MTWHPPDGDGAALPDAAPAPDGPAAAPRGGYEVSGFGAPSPYARPTAATGAGTGTGQPAYADGTPSYGPPASPAPVSSALELPPGAAPWTYPPAHPPAAARPAWRSPAAVLSAVVLLIAVVAAGSYVLREPAEQVRGAAAAPSPPPLPRSPTPTDVPTPEPAPTSRFRLPSPAPSPPPVPRSPAPAPLNGVPPLPAGVPGPEAGGTGVFATDDGSWHIVIDKRVMDFYVLATDEGSMCPPSLFAGAAPPSCKGYDRALAASPDGQVLADAVLVNAGSVAAAKALLADTRVTPAAQAGGGSPIAAYRHQVPDTQWVFLATARQVQGAPISLEQARPLLEGLRYAAEDPVLATLYGGPGPS